MQVGQASQLRMFLIELLHIIQEILFNITTSCYSDWRDQVRIRGRIIGQTGGIRLALEGGL